MISISDLEWFFTTSDGGCSPTGPMLERADLFRVTRKHKRMRTVDAAWKLAPRAFGAKQEKCIHYAEQATLHELHSPGSYELDWGIVDRRVKIDRFVRRQPPNIKRALEALYGFEARWERTCARLSLLKLTPLGRSIVEARRVKDRANASGGQESHNSDTQLIWNDIQDQVTHPNDVRRMRHVVMWKQADALWADVQRAIARTKGSAA